MEFEVDESLLGLIIGKKGAHIEQVKKDSGVRSIRTRKDKGKGKKKLYYTYHSCS